jgi:hypothetical protein
VKIKDDREHIVVCVVSTPVCCNFSLSKSVILRKINHFIFFNIVVRLVFVSASGCYSFHKREKIQKGLSKNGQSRETGKQRVHKTKKTNATCVEHHYAQTNTHSVNET